MNTNADTFIFEKQPSEKCYIVQLVAELLTTQFYINILKIIQTSNNIITSLITIYIHLQKFTCDVTFCDVDSFLCQTLSLILLRCFVYCPKLILVSRCYSLDNMLSFTIILFIYVFFCSKFLLHLFVLYFRHVMLSFQRYI